VACNLPHALPTGCLPRPHPQLWRAGHARRMALNCWTGLDGRDPTVFAMTRALADHLPSLATPPPPASAHYPHLRDRACIATALRTPPPPPHTCTYHTPYLYAHHLRYHCMGSPHARLQKDRHCTLQ